MIKFFRSQEELLARIAARRKQNIKPEIMLAEIGELMKQARFIPLDLRELYEDVVEDTETAHQEGRECTCLNLWLHPEDNHTVTETAMRSLSILESAARRSDDARFTRTAAQFRSWKWMLGHQNADFLIDEFSHMPHELVRLLTYELMSGMWESKAGNEYAKKKNQIAMRERIIDEANKRSTTVQTA